MNESQGETYLDELRGIVISFMKATRGLLPSESDLEVPKLKELHAKLWELGQPDGTFNQMIADWNSRVPTIPWEMES
tara:strand:- start:15677 stop:15907 length:231 start_codon:yes stop_codon:yes gene_type:complete